MTAARSSAAQTSALTRLFAARFFDNDLIGGGGDLRSSFFWLLAFLAPIGILMPWSRSLQYTCYYLVGGSETLSYLAVEDIAFYLGLGMVATGMIGVITWPSFLPDRRDALVLGSLPVPGPVLVRAKLLAVFAYGVVLAIGMHAGSSLTFGLLMTNGRPFSFVIRSILVHFVVACLASLFVLVAILAGQAVLAAVSSRSMFARLSPVLQIATASGVLGLLIALPAASSTLLYADERWGLALTRQAVRACAPGMRGQLGIVSTGPRPWADLLPVAWFTGLYELLLGTALPSTRALATTAGLAGVVAFGVAVWAYPIAARRVMRSEIEGTPWRGRASLGTSVVAWAVRLMARQPAEQAALQFFSASTLRVSTHRFVLSLGIGATFALLLPGAFAGVRALQAAKAMPSIALLSLPLTMMIGAIVSVRVVASIPSELGGAWMLRLVQVPAVRSRSAVRKTMVLAGVAAPLLLCTPVYWMLWGEHLALTHAVVCASVGLLLVELALWGFAAMPCAAPWTPSHANLRAWWPVYIGAFLLLTQAPPRISLALAHSWRGVAAYAAGLAVLQFLIGWANGRRKVPAEPDDLLAPHVLELR